MFKKAQSQSICYWLNKAIKYFKPILYQIPLGHLETFTVWFLNLKDFCWLEFLSRSSSASIRAVWLVCTCIITISIIADNNSTRKNFLGLGIINTGKFESLILVYQKNFDILYKKYLDNLRILSLFAYFLHRNWFWCKRLGRSFQQCSMKDQHHLCW